MKTIRLLCAAALLPLVSFAQVVNLQQPAATYTDNEIPRRNGTGNQFQASSVVIDDAASSNITIGAATSANDITVRGGVAGATIGLGRAATGAITITAAGTNQTITLTPSGTGLTKFQGASQASYIGSLIGGASYGAVYFGNVTPSALNYALTSNGQEVVLNAPSASGNIVLSANNNTLVAKFFGTTQHLLLGGLSTDGTGVLELPASTTSAGGITAGTDTFWFRSAANVWNAGATSTLKARYVQGTATTNYIDFDATNLGLYGGNVLALTLDSSSQNATFSAATIMSTDTLSGAGAISVTKDTTKFTSTGSGQALTLANGTDGQIKHIIHDVDGGSGVLTPTTKTGFSTVTFVNAGDSVTLEYVTTRGWIVVGSYGSVIAP